MFRHWRNVLAIITAVSLGGAIAADAARSKREINGCTLLNAGG
jgi:hypothetical protein